MQDVYQVITDRIVSMLESGQIPWERSWSTLGGAPRSFVSKKAYRGINTWMLGCSHYDSPFWLTFNQAKAKGGKVRKGEKGTPVVFWKRWKTKDKQSGEEKIIPMLKMYYVFNANQVEGIEFPTPEARNPEAQPLETCETIVNGFATRPTINKGFGRACYIPSADRVEMPHVVQFNSEEEYYSVLFHELIHSTGHKDRLNRFAQENNTNHSFGSTSYAKEELVAEMGAAFLCGHAGIMNRTVQNSAAYIQGWLKSLKNDKKLVVQAAGQAQKASDLILGVTWDSTGEKEEA
jgi:antirestriction protein ArdC